jgi:hypothetical protein
VAGGALRSGSDADEACWVVQKEWQQNEYRLAPLTVQVIEKAFRLEMASGLSNKESEA